MSVEFDLLGDPIPSGFGKRGRPPHEATAEKRKLVMLLAAFDWTQGAIAGALGITEPTLRKNYFRELKFRPEARVRVEAALINRLFAEAMDGKVGAIDKFFKRLEKSDAKALASVYQSAGPDKGKPKSVPLGKKETRKAEAQAVSGVFAPPPPPRMN